MSKTAYSLDHRVPQEAWSKTWILALAITLCVLGFWEFALRNRGFRPSLNDIPSGELDSWIVERTRARLASPSTFLVAGDSRVELAFVPEVFARETGSDSPIMLTVGGSSPLPLLGDLAGDASVENPVLMGVNPIMLFSCDARVEKRTQEWIEREEHTHFGERLEFWLDGLAVTHLAMRHRMLTPINLFAALCEGRWPSPQFFVLLRDRSCRADHSRYTPLRYSEANTLDEWRDIQIEKYRNSFRTPTDAEFLQLVDEISTCAAQLRARGSRLFLVRFPSSGIVREIERERMPREKYWDRLVERAVDAEAIHFEDYASLESFTCLDGSHMDYPDSARFTEALSRIVSDRMSKRLASRRSLDSSVPK